MRTALAAVVAALLATVALACQPAGEVTLIVGDSNTVGASWATQLAADCRPAVWAWGGTGILRSGPTGGRPLTLTAELDAIIAGRTGDHVVVMLGTNDALGRDPLPTTAQLNALTARFVDGGAASVRWMTVPPFRSAMNATTRARRATLNSAILGTPNPVDARGAFGGSNDLPVSLSSDSIHLNQAGHATLGYFAATGTTICG